MKNDRNVLSNFSIILIFIFFSLIGLFLTPFLSYKLNPSQKTPSIKIEYKWQDVSPKVLEGSVTYKLEQVLSTIEDVVNINSISSKGKGIITIKFNEFTNIDKAFLGVSSVVRQIYYTLPKGVSYPTISASGNNENNTTLMTLSISSQLSLDHILPEIKSNIISKISKINGISNVNVFGIPNYEVKITCNDKKLESYRIEKKQIKNALSSFFKKKEVNNFIINNKSVIAKIYGNSLDKTNINTLNEIPIAQRNGKIIYLDQIAKISKKQIKNNGYKKFNGLNAITMNVEAESNANQLEISNELNKIINVFNSDRITLSVLYDSTLKLRNEFLKVIFRTMMSLIILLLFVLLFSKNLKYLALILVSLISNILIAIILYYFFKVDIHFYSLAGLTISFGLIIDNSIIMTDHLINHNNKKVFVSIFAATLTTIGALSIIFFINKEHQLYLIDFSWIVIINLIISLLVSQFLMPSLNEKLKIKKHKKWNLITRKKKIIKFTNLYSRILVVLLKGKTIVFLVFIFSFGIPIFLIQDKVERGEEQSKFFKQVTQSDFYKNEIKKRLKYIGGTLYLFLKKNEKGFFLSRPKRLSLKVRLLSPEGATTNQMNKAILYYEEYLKSFNEVEMFLTEVFDVNSGMIKIFFKEPFEETDFPYNLKRKLEERAIELGGISTSIYGVGLGFSNNVNAISDASIKIVGHNLSKLNLIAENVKDSILLKHPRINDVKINSKKSWILKDNFEYKINGFKNYRLNQAKLNSKVLYDELLWYSGNDIFTFNYQNLPVNLRKRKDYLDVWEIKNKSLTLDSIIIPINDIASFKKTRTPLNITRKNKEYQLYLDYSFGGTYEYNRIVLKELLHEINKEMPIGFKALDPNNDYISSKDEYIILKMIVIIILIIYFITAILFESLLQPLAVVLMIPVSYIGVFITFFLFDINFDQGGVASFIMLSGIVVNSSIYIINDYNNIKTKKVPSLKSYLKAFNSKITPILLTIFSTIIGLLPFIVYDGDDFFWTAFAYGNIGGLLFSIITLMFFLPLCLKLKTVCVD